MLTCSNLFLESSLSPTLSQPQLLHLQNGMKSIGQGQFRKPRSLGSRFKARLWLWARAFLSLGPGGGDGGAHPACCVFSEGCGEVHCSLGLRSSARHQAPLHPVGKDSFSSGSQEPGPGCVTLSRGLCLSGLSLPICTVGMGGG